MLSKLFFVVIKFLYELTLSFGNSIIIFTLFTKIVLFPISLMSQKNSIIMVRLMPEIDELKARYENDPNQFLKEQKALYKREKYSTIKAMLPLLLQIPIIIGVVGAVNLAVGDSQTFNFTYLGMNLGEIPTFSSVLVIIPILAVLSTLLMCWVQNVYNVVSREQSFFSQWGTTIFLCAFSGYFAFACPAGVGLYWVAGNVMSALIQFLLNAIYNPKKYIDYENRSVKPKLSKAEKLEKKQRKIESKRKDKEDSKRFYAAGHKQLCFYSESSGFYKYYKSIISSILENSDIHIHYITNDMDDQVFKINHPRFHAYYSSNYGFITLAMKIDADVVVMTTPDLENYHIKRSLINKKTEYIYLDHGLTSLHMNLREGALDHFDTVFCYIKSHNEEIRKTEQIYSLPQKTLVNTGFALIDDLTESYNKLSASQVKNSRPQILIAPSWQKDNICESCLYDIVNGLTGKGYNLILRPHPEFVKRFPSKIKKIIDVLQKYDDVTVQTDFSSSDTVYLSDIVITDWSGIGMEFSLTTKKATLFINTPIKVMNLNYKKIDIEPVEIWTRNKIGVSVNPENIGDINSVVSDMLNNSEKYRTQIEDILYNQIYNYGRAADAAAGYIIDRIEYYENNRKKDFS